MNYSYRLHPIAEKEYSDAYAWYEDAQLGLGERFIETATKKIESIAVQPDVYGSKRKGYRETIISKDFPYTIVYKVNHHKKEVFISSIFHSKRNPGRKYRR